MGNGEIMDVIVNSVFETGNADDTKKKYKVTIETRNGAKFFTMSADEFDSMMHFIDYTQGTFVKVPGSNLYINIPQIVYINVREIKDGENF